MEDKIFDLSKIYEVPVFRKTSCLISYTHSMERDYNAHYYRPNEMRCNKCPMNDKCFKFKLKNDLYKAEEIKLDNIPFDYKIVNKEKHCCILFKMKECKFPSSDCLNISGKMIEIKQKITSSDLRVIKWLTGLTIDCDFKEVEFLSDNWKINLDICEIIL